jgi:hypothetical protein
MTIINIHAMATLFLIIGLKTSGGRRFYATAIKTGVDF